MQKIISVFQRNYGGDHLIRNEVVPGAEWVIAGEGIATRKLDGSCCLIKEGQFYKRHEVKKGKKPPADFIQAQDPDPITGHCVGWLPVGSGPEDRWFREAYENTVAVVNGQQRAVSDGTFEAIGPHFQGNPEGVEKDVLVQHGLEIYEECPRTFDGIREFLRERDIEGVVFHHPDGRMAKVKKKDYGIPRGVGMSSPKALDGSFASLPNE